MADETQDQGTQTGGGQGEDQSQRGEEKFDLNTPLEDPKLETARKGLLADYTRKTQGVAEKTRDLEAREQEIASQRQELQEILAQLDAEGGKGKGDDETPDETPATVSQVKKLEEAFQTLDRMQREFMIEVRAQRIVAETQRELDKYPDLIPPLDSEDAEDQKLRETVAQIAISRYAEHADSQAAKPIAPHVKATVEFCRKLRTRGKRTVTTTSTEERGKAKQEGGGGEVPVPDELKDVPLGDPKLLAALEHHFKEE